jgi:NDP-sugar pyrophosphorylase family protein
MKPNELYATPMEDEFNNWLARFESLEDLFASRYQLHTKLRKQQLDGDVEDHTLLIGPIHVSPTSRVLAGAVIKGPAIIGPDVTIDCGAKVLGGSFIGAGSRVGPGAVVSQSILMNGSVVSENCVIQNAILGAGAFVGAGAMVGEEQDESMGEEGAFVGDSARISAGSVVPKCTVITKESVYSGSSRASKGGG